MNEIVFGRPLLGPEEKAAVMEVLDGPILVHGPRAAQFEESFAAYTDAPYAISVSSCTAGMHLVYFAHDFGPDDEVIVPAQTHAATAHAVELTGAKAVFVDVELSTGNISIDAIERAITSKTRAIAVVHYLGVPVDMEAINKIAKKYNLLVVEDCALAPGVYIDGKHAGLKGDVGVFSFYPVKHFTTAEGGMIITKDKKLADKLRLLKAFGVDRSHGERKIPGMYDVVALGFNYRMSEIHAAIGIEQLKKLPEFLRVRKNNFEILEMGLANLEDGQVIPQPVNDRFISSHYCLGFLLNKPIVKHRAKIMEELSIQKIGSSVYYPQPVPRMKYYKDKYGYEAEIYKNAERISDGMIALPVGPHLDDEDMLRISQALQVIMETLSD